MTDVLPQRLAILVHLCDVLKRVTLANGYKTDVGDRVYRGKGLFGADEKLPFLSVLEQPIPETFPDSASDNPANILILPLIVQGWADEDQDNPTDLAHMLMADVRKCLAAEKVRARRTHDLLDMHGTVTDLRVGLGTVRPAETGVSDTSFFWMVVTVEGAENLLDPYEWATR